MVADLGHLRDGDDTPAAAFEKGRHLGLCAAACVCGLSKPKFDLDGVVPGEHPLEGCGHVAGAHPVLGAPRPHVLQMGEQPLERPISPVDGFGLPPLPPLAENVGFGLFVDADGVEAAAGREVLVLRRAWEVGVRVELALDLDEDLQAGSCCDAAEVLPLIDRLEHDDELRFGRSQ
ncbi:MAG: hypothetical protein ACRCY9_14020 [Phycicoccus sp.]